MAGATGTLVATAVCNDGSSSASAALGGATALVGTDAAAAAAAASLWSGFLTDISAAGLGSSEFWARVASCETAHHVRTPHSIFNTRHGIHRRQHRAIAIRHTHMSTGKVIRYAPASRILSRNSCFMSKTL